MIAVRNLTKVFRQGKNEVRGLAGVDLTVARGEFLTVIGPSGSGKSTLLHLIGGLDTPTSGDVEIDGRRLGDLDDDTRTVFRRRHIGFVFQLFNLLPTLTAEENVALPLRLDGQPAATIRERVTELLALVNLAERRDHRPDQLSGGELQRVAIARALVNDPLVLLADEPTGNLDRRTGAQILEVLHRSIAARHPTVVLVTHDERLAASGDRTITLEDGRIVDELTRR
jgi:putative ABC transport system ATP-binding protein